MYILFKLIRAPLNSSVGGATSVVHIIAHFRLAIATDVTHIVSANQRSRRHHVECVVVVSWQDFKVTVNSQKYINKSYIKTLELNYAKTLLQK